MILTENLFCNTYSLNSQNQRKRETADLAGIFEPSWFSSIAKKSFQQNKTKKNLSQLSLHVRERDKLRRLKNPGQKFQNCYKKYYTPGYYTRLVHEHFFCTAPGLYEFGSRTKEK